MDVLWKVTGEEVSSKMTPYLDSYQLEASYPVENGMVYRMYLERYSQYQRLEELVLSLGLDITVRSNAEWLAVIAMEDEDSPLFNTLRKK